MNKPNPGSQFPSRIEQLLSRARKAQRRGERRQALVAFREAALLAESDPRIWALYGSACFKSNRRVDAERALGQALYLRQRAHDLPRAEALQALIERLALGCAA
jgi:Flp pilus assembly protein TadD